MSRRDRLLFTVCVVFASGSAAAAADEVPVVHRLNSPRQSAATVVNVLLPVARADGQTFRVLYVLPVEAGETTHWGNSLAEVLKHDLHNQHQLICVFPTFADLPWYADHPTNLRRQQESYFLKDVIPLVEANYPVQPDRDGRLLVGFSKSGWGAWALLLRHPQMFRRAAAFDAPLMMDGPGKYGSGPIFGNDSNFRRYQVTRLLAAGTALESSTQAPRLGLFGKGNFQQEHRQLLTLATELEIPVFVEESSDRVHSWHSGWLPDAVKWLTTGD